MPAIDYSDISENPPRRIRKNSFWILGILSTVTVLILGSTLASNINLTSSGPVEFGQGIAQTTVWAGTTPITITPIQSFRNSSGGGDFYFTGISFSNIPSGCIGANFKINAFGQGDNNSRSLTQCSHHGNSPITHFAGNSATGPTSSTDSDMYTHITNKSATGFTLEWEDAYDCQNSSLFQAKDVYRITVETGRPSSTGTPIVFLTPSSPGNTTGKTFEVTSASMWADYNIIANWCNDGINHGISDTAIGTGERNTAAWIATDCTNPQIDALQSFNLAHPGQNWLIPSKDEMLAIQSSLPDTNAWDPGGPWLWTSSEVDQNQMWMLENNGWTNTTDDKRYSSRVVLVRSY